MDFLKCKTNFQELINSDYGATEQCIKIFKEKMIAREDIYEDLLNGFCIKITNKKTGYYNKIYDPAPIISNFKKLLGEENPVYLKFIEYCNPTVNDKCCNCVSVSLYILNSNKYDYLSRFIFTIQQSIINLAKYLPDWIYRLYLDPSVFEAINAVKTKAESDITNKEEYIKLYELYVDTIKNIASQPNCEIYLTSCTDYSGDNMTAGKRRNSRFTGFVEEDVNINASREGDGLVDFIDCYNLKVFENLPIATFAYHLGSGPGTNYYVKTTGGKFQDLIFSFSAGLVASKFKIKQTIFEQAKKNVLDNYRLIKEDNFQAYDEHFLIELFKVFSNNNTHVEQIKYLFGLLPMGNRDSAYSSQNYYVTIDNIILDKLTNNGYSDIDTNAFLDNSAIIKINENHTYKNDELLLSMAKYSMTKTEDDDNFYKVAFFMARLSILHIIYNTEFFDYIQQFKTEHNNKFINLCCMYEISNIATDGTVITETDGHFDYTSMNLFNEVLLNLRTNIPMIGGNQINDMYFNKYLKYKSKYMKLKNKTA